MMKLSILYPNGPSMRFDKEYYMSTHMALVNKLLGPVLKGYGVEMGVPTPEGPAPFYIIAYLIFDSAETLQTALATHGPTLMADIPNYTDSQPLLQMSDILVSVGQPSSAQAAG